MHLKLQDEENKRVLENEWGYTRSYWVEKSFGRYYGSDMKRTMKGKNN
jgi:hypothetical protein